MSGTKVLRVSIPVDISMDGYKARLLLAVELYREGRLTIKQALNSPTSVSRIL